MTRTETPRADISAGPGRWLVLAGVWLIYFCFGVTAASMAPLVEPVGDDLGIGNARMGLILGAWPLAYIAAAIPCGILLDRFGVRRMLFVATLVMAVSGLARSLADSPTQMFLAVALFGLGGPLISIGAPKVIARLFEGPARGMAMGVYVTGPYLGGILALALTNSVAMPLAGYDWRGVMLIYSALVAASGGIWLAIAYAPVTAWPTRDDDGGKKFNLGAFAELVRVPEVRLILGMSVGIFYINHALNNWLPEILKGHGFSPVEAGNWAAVPSALGIVGALVVPRLATPERRLKIMALLFAASLVASLCLHFSSLALILPGLIAQGIARGSMMTIAILILMETPSVPPERLGLAGGLFFTAAEIGGVLGPVAFGVLSALGAGFALPLVSMTLVCLILFVIVARLRRAAASA
ncbi:CynX/NimT family MFS transporter [Jannaschia seohaensis]|uniref:Cyanate permease n=1 Tax=Jannaschia seohaensis TaxID=475081 RepID=A0A2Y8ZZ16_9RHOB|nr:MFS transporter [Jannaschia seohaensis]PWJ21622.1 cyanate permease [Jannaschia seohaensis]SSA37410.1 Cyanate permease [Jannaschia seohaensis]